VNKSYRLVMESKADLKGLQKYLQIPIAWKQSTLLPWALAFFPILIYLEYIVFFGVDVIYWDEWNLFPMIHDFFAGTMTFSELWEQHNENRMLFPNLFFLLLAKTVHFDTKVGMFVGAFFLMLSFLLLYSIYRKHFQSRIWAFVPVSYLLFGLVQYENTLWGFQVAWYMILACLLGMFSCLERPYVTWTFGISIALAILASFSSMQGLFLWPAGFVYLWANNYSLRSKALWIVSFLLTVLTYFMGFDFHNTGGSSVLAFFSHPVNAIAYFFVVVGSVIQVGGVEAKGAIGIVLFLLALHGAFRGVLSAKSDRSYLFPLGLMVFVFLFDASLVVGRSGFGVGQATSSRYSTYNILLLIAIYISSLREISASFAGKKQGWFVAVSVILVLAVQVPSSYVSGMKSGLSLYQGRTQSANTLRSFRTAPRKLIERDLWSNYDLVFQRASWAELYRFSVFREEK